MDEEQFMQELEEDDEMRRNVQLFRDPNAAAAAAAAGATETDDDDDDDVPTVPIECLLDELSLAMNRGDGGEGYGGGEEEDDGAYDDDDEDMAD